MHRRFRSPAILVCLAACFRLGFSSHVNETTGASPDSFAAAPEAGMVTVTGRVLFPNRRGDMREVSRVRVNLYDYEWSIIFIQNGVTNSSDTVVHEIGHNYMYNVTQSHYWYNNSSCYQHDIWTAAEVRCGWSEGWADFFPLLVDGDYCYDKGSGPCTGIRDSQYFDLENQGWNDGHATGPTVEGRVAGALYDLYDSNNEGPFDNATNSFEALWVIMRDRIPCAETLSDFGNSWQNTGYDYAQFLSVSFQNTIDYGPKRTYLPLIMK